MLIVVSAAGGVWGERGAIPERDVGQRQQQPAVRGAPRVGVLGQHPEPHHEPVALLPIEERPDQIEKRTRPEQRLEPGGNVDAIMLGVHVVHRS